MSKFHEEVALHAAESLRYVVDGGELASETRLALDPAVRPGVGRAVLGNVRDQPDFQASQEDVEAVGRWRYLSLIATGNRGKLTGATIEPAFLHILQKYGLAEPE